MLRKIKELFVFWLIGDEILEIWQALHDDWKYRSELIGIINETYDELNDKISDCKKSIDNAMSEVKDD